MKWTPVFLLALLPSVLLAGVTVASSPASTEVYLMSAWKAMEDGDYVAAWALYECALERNPHSPEALAGYSAARSASEECAPAVPHTVAGN